MIYYQAYFRTQINKTNNYLLLYCIVLCMHEGNNDLISSNTILCDQDTFGWFSFWVGKRGECVTPTVSHTPSIGLFTVINFDCPDIDKFVKHIAGCDAGIRWFVIECR
jgi:hypothetical protein